MAIKCLRKPESIACRGLHCRPANGAGDILRFAGAARAGEAKPRPLRRDREMALIFFAGPAFCGAAAGKNDFAQMFSCALHQDGLK